jgi:tetratricopeptide (TPR) repeat protein
MLRAPCLGLCLGLISTLCFAQSPASSAPASPAGAIQPAAQSSTPPEAQATVETGIRSGANAFPVNLLGEGRALYRKGNFEAAIAKYQEFLKDHPHSPDAFAGMVRVYLKQKNAELAAQTAEQGLKQTDSPRMHVAEGEVLFRQGRIGPAEAEWVKVINSGYPEARAFLGEARVRHALAMYKGEKAMLDRAHQIDPDDPDIYEEWIGTLSRAKRISYLEDSLAGDNNWDPDERGDVVNYLRYLKERAKQKSQSSCRLVSKVSATETPLVRLLEDPQHLRGYGLHVYLNGHKSALMLDTGASGILVRRAAAERAGITKISETKVWGIGKKGRRNAYIGVADSIKIGELEFQNCPIEVMESRSVAGDEGLIGADVLENFLVDIDFPNEKLKLSQLPVPPGASHEDVTLKSEDDDSDDSGDDDSDKSDAGKSSGVRSNDTKPSGVNSSDVSSSDGAAANAKSAAKSAAKPAPTGPQDAYIAPEMKDYTRVFRFGHNLMIPTSIGPNKLGKVPQKLFLIDTGSLVNFISPEAAREVTKVHGDSDMIVEGISGRVDKVYSANKAILIFGHLKQENQDITALDTKPISDNLGTEVSGFLGFTTLRMLDIKIDYRDALVDFTYDAKRFGR